MKSAIEPESQLHRKPKLVGIGSAEPEYRQLELKSDQDRQRESPTRLRTILDDVSYVTFQLSVLGIIEHVSPKIRKIYGYDPESLVGRHFKTVTPEGEISKALDAFHRVLSGQDVANFEINQLDARGVIVLTEIILTPVKKESEVVALHGIMRAIDRSKRLEERLRLSEEKFFKVFLNTPDAIIISTLVDGVILDINESFTHLSGYTREEVIGRSSTQIPLWAKEDDRYRIIRMLKERGFVRNIEAVFRIKSGRERTCKLSAETIEIGNSPCIISVVSDITEQREAEDKLRKSEERHRLLTENMADVIWIVGIERPNLLTYVTPSITRLLGYTVEEAKKKMMEEVFTPHSYQLAMKTLGEELASAKVKAKELSKSRTLELELIHRNGTTVPVEAKCNFICSPDRSPVEIMVTVRDITERKRADEEQRLSTEKLVKAMEDMIQAMARIVEMRDPYTAGHQRRVAKLACAIGEEIGLSKEQIHGLRLAALIHDIGKVRIPAEILAQPKSLSKAEFAILMTHPGWGYEIMKNIDLPWPISKIIYQHHERMNGSGYPSGISGEEIIIEARILAVADVVEAISSHRPYRPALGIDKALAEISQQEGQLFDTDVVKACLKLFQENGFDSFRVSETSFS